MAFLTLLGITVPISTSSNGAIEPSRAGEYGRTFSHKPYSAVRAESRDYRGATPFMARTTSLAYQLLVSGQGEAFPYDNAGSGAAADYYSTKGLSPESVSGTLATTATGGPVSNGGRLTVHAGEEVVYLMPRSPLSTSTLSVWLKSPGTPPDAGTGGVWKHFVVERDGSNPLAAWVNGVSVAVDSDQTPHSVESWLTNTNAGSFYGAYLVLDVVTGGGDDVDVAELLALPFRASLLRSDWASYMYNSGSGRAVEDLPYLSMGGTWVPPGDSTQTDEVLGEVMGQRLVDTTVSGTTVQFEAFDFTLRSRNVR